MASRTLHIQVGDRLTKVCLSAKKGKTYQIISSFMFQTPENAVSDGVITAPDLFGGKLNEELARHGVAGTKTAVFSLASGKVATREVILPPVKDARIKGIVESNASEYFPIDLSKYHVTYKLLERITKGEQTGCRVLVFAAPVSLLESYYRTADFAGLVIQAIDFSGNSQYQALRSLRSKGVCMYVNVDCSNSLITFMGDGKLLLQRSLTFGGDELILNYMGAAGKNSDEYLDALQECSQESSGFLTDDTMPPSLVEDGLSRLVSNISRSCDFFNSNRWDSPVEMVVLMGPCGRLAGLRDMVIEATGLETVYLDDVPGISSFANAAERASFYISCIGSSIDPVDFLLPYMAQDRKKHARRKEKSDAHSIRDGVLILAVCFLAACGLSAWAILQYRDALDEKRALEEEIAGLEYAREAHDEYLQFQTVADGLLQLDSLIDSPNDGLTAFIKELEEKMPSEILLLSATCGREEISMNVTVPSFDEVAVVLVQLRSFESVEDVSISAVTENVDDAGIETVSFSVSCAYKSANPAAEQGTETAAAEEVQAEEVQ